MYLEPHIIIYDVDILAFSCYVNLIVVVVIIFADLLVAEFVEWPALVPGCLHCLHRLAQPLSRIVHEQIKEGDPTETDILLGERAEHVEDPYGSLLLPVTNHCIE